MNELPLPQDRKAITPEWMERALRAGGMTGLPALGGLALEDIGAGAGLMGEVLRCRLAWRGEPGDAPATVVVKLPAASPKSARLGRKQLLYRREYDYYRGIAAQAPVRSPKLLYGDCEGRGRRFVLVLEDLRAMARADQVRGASAEQALRAVREIAGLHGRFWNVSDRPRLAGCVDLLAPRYLAEMQKFYSACLDPALEAFGDLFPGRMRRIAANLDLAGLGRRIAEAPATFVHGDFRLDNMFFGTGPGDGFALIDWQLCGIGSGLYDVAYFLATNVEPELRRETERQAVEEYHAIVRGLGAADFAVDDCWRLYRQNTLACLAVSVCVCGGLKLDDGRSRQLAATGLRRALAAIGDLDADRAG